MLLMFLNITQTQIIMSILIRTLNASIKLTIGKCDYVYNSVENDYIYIYPCDKGRKENSSVNKNEDCRLRICLVGVIILNLI